MDTKKNVDEYGYLYNWVAAMKVCPNGWHLPTDEEWTQLTDYVRGEYYYVCGNDDANIAKALASEGGWESNEESCTVGNAPSSNNATGFGALPAGVQDGSSYDCFGRQAIFWSATEHPVSRFVWCRNFGYDIADVRLGYYSNYYGLSVRCVKD